DHQDVADVRPLSERFADRRARQRTVALHLAEDRRLVQLQPDVHRDREQNRREEERDAPAAALEARARRQARDQDHDERERQTESPGGLDPASVAPATTRRGVLGEKDRRTAVLSAERESLQEPQPDQRDGSRHPDRGIAGQAADEEGG